MRNILTAAVITAALLAMPALGLAAPVGAAAPVAGTVSSGASTTQRSMHATKGVVTFVNATKLMIERSPRHGGIITFLLNPSTERDGNVRVGSPVEVRYRTEAHQRIATVVTVEHAKAAASAPGSQQ